MSNTADNFDFMELGQAVQKARKKQRITHLVTMFHISVDQYIHPEAPAEKSTLRRQSDALFDTFDDKELRNCH